MVYNIFVMSKQKTGVKLLKIGELASLFKVLPSTINFYTRAGLLKADGRSRGGYRLYDSQKSLKTLEKITALQTKKRLTILEIKKSLK